MKAKVLAVRALIVAAVATAAHVALADDVVIGEVKGTGVGLSDKGLADCCDKLSAYNAPSDVGAAAMQRKCAALGGSTIRNITASDSNYCQVVGRTAGYKYRCEGPMVADCVKYR